MIAPPTRHHDTASWNRWISVAGLAAAVPALFAPSVGRAVSDLVRVVDLDHAYFNGVRPALLYGWMPLVVAASLVLLMAPGLLAAALLGRSRTVWNWILDGFALTLVLVSGATAIVQAVTGHSVVGAGFVLVVVGLTAALGVVSEWRRRAEQTPTHPQACFIWVSLLAVPMLLLVSTLPKFFWEALNGDGAHMVEATRLLLFQSHPFFSAEAGVVASWPGVNGLVVPYQASWFMRLFGQVEASVRLPLLLDMALLFAAIGSVAEAGRPRSLQRSALLLIWGSVTTFALTMSFAATYNPYNADMSMPAPQDTLAMAAYLSAVAAFFNGDRGRLVVWACLSLLVSPIGLLSLGLTLGALGVVGGRAVWKSLLAHGAGLAGLMVAIGASGALLAWLGVLHGGDEHGGVRLLIRQFGTIALLDVTRLAWVVVPSGLYPIAALAGWRAADAPTRVLMVATGLLFGFFYAMGNVSLHYFVPVMVLPVAAFWRQHTGIADWSRLPQVACCAAVVVALVLASPRGQAVYDGTRLVGERIDVSAYAGYAVNEPHALLASEALGHLFVTDAHPDVPDRRYGDSPLAWHYYAQRRPAVGPAAYVLAPKGALPPGAFPAGESGSTVAGVYDEAAWTRDRVLVPRRSEAREILSVPRHVLYFDANRSPRLGYFEPHRWPWLRHVVGLPPLDDTLR